MSSFQQMNNYMVIYEHICTNAYIFIFTFVYSHMKVVECICDQNLKKKEILAPLFTNETESSAAAKKKWKEKNADICDDK